MKILYDGFTYRMQSRGGINRVFNEILSRLSGEQRGQLLLTGYSPHGNLYTPGSNLEVTVSRRIRPHRLFGILEQYQFMKSIERFKPDILHPTYYGTLYKNLWNRKEKIVLTVHDMVHEIYPELLDPEGEYRKEKKQAIEKADHFITVSKNTKADLQEYYDIPEDQISVVYNGAPDPVRPESKPEGEITSPKRYFMYVGSRAVYKNFTFLLQAFSKIQGSTEGDLKLKVIGPEPNAEEQRTINDLKLHECIEFDSQAKDSDLSEYYSHAIALIYPSLYEGFGIPPLEAMAHDTPVICSETSSLPEVVGDAAVLIDPHSLDSLVEGMRALAHDNVDRKELIKRGREQLKHFSWDKTYQETIEVYRKLLS